MVPTNRIANIKDEKEMTKTYFIIIFIAAVVTNIGYTRDIYGEKSGQELSMEKYDYAKLYTELYVGMPESDFVKLYDENNNLKDESKPRIVEHQNNQYYLQFKDGKARVTFEVGKLSKLEVLRRDEPPFAFLVYSDATHSLKGFVDDKGFYDGMSEKEFLREFSGSILKHSHDMYVFLGKNGKKYRVKFYNGYLIGMESL